MIEKAIEKYRLAIKINPKYSAAYNNIGSALYDSKKIEDAIYYYNRAI